MTFRQALIVAAVFCAVAVVAIDLSWVDVDGNQHLPAWVGLSLATFFGSHLVNR